MVWCSSVLTKILCLLLSLLFTFKEEQAKSSVSENREYYLCFSSVVFIMVDKQNTSEETDIPPSLYSEFKDVSLRNYKFVRVF